MVNIGYYVERAWPIDTLLLTTLLVWLKIITNYFAAFLSKIKQDILNLTIGENGQ